MRAVRIAEWCRSIGIATASPAPLPVTRTYRNTQNVRRFLRSQCGDGFKFDRPFMQWIKDGAAKTMGDVADEWLRRRSSR